MTIQAFTDYPEKGTYGAEVRRNLNAAIHQYVQNVIDIYPAYATTTWYKEKYKTLVDQGDFGLDHSQVIQAQLCILGLKARGSHKEFYQELVEFIPFLGEYLTVMNRNWELKEATKESMASHDFATVVVLPTTTPTKVINEALDEHGEMLESTLKGLEGATGVARGRRNLQDEFVDDEDEDEDDEDEDDDEEEVLDFNKKLTPIQDDDDEDEGRKDQRKEDQAKKTPVAATLKAGKQLTLDQLADPDSVARTMLKSKHLEKVIAKAVRTSALTAQSTVNNSFYTKLQGKATEQEAVNKALKASLADQEKEMISQKTKAEALQKRLDQFIKNNITNPISQVPSALTQPLKKQHPHSLTDPQNQQKADDYLLLNPNKNSNKFFNYFHDGVGWTMQPQSYADSRLPKMKIKYYVDTIGLMRNFAIHAAQFGIFIHKIEDIESWDDRNENPPTCPYNIDITNQCNKVYTLAANKIYTKLSHTIELKHPVLKQSFNEAGQFADGYIALYYLQSYGNPKFIDRSVEMPKPQLGNSRDISLFCRNLHNYSMYKTLIGDTPTKLNLYEYAVSQINENFPDEYTKGIKEVEDKINVWRALSKNPVIGPSQPFPRDADIEGSNLAFAIMRKYTENEARVLFQEDTNEEEVITIDRAEINATQSSRYQNQDTNRSRYNSNQRGDRNRSQQWQRNDDGGKRASQRKPKTNARYPTWKFREGTYCSICGSEGHEATEDGCFATGRFLRLIKSLDQTLYRRIKQKYGDLVTTIDRKLQDSIDQKAAKRKERNAKINLMELADRAWEVSESEDDARQICINCAYGVFPDIDGDSSEDEFTDAESS